MKIFIAISILTISFNVNAQLFGRKDLSIHRGIMRFDPPSLNNSVNSNGRRTRLFEVDKNFYLKRRISFNTGIGLGNLENLDNRFEAYQSSQFFRLKLGFILHQAQHHTPRNWSPKKFNPFIKVAYNLDLFDHSYSSVNGSTLGSSLRLGLGCVIKINHYLGLSYEFSHNQRVTKDYRTFYQNTLGLVINMDQIWLPY